MTAKMFLVLPAILVLAGCNPQLDERVSASNGAQLYAENCVACHGADARGGVGPDLTLLASRNGGVFPEIAALATIYGSVGHVNPERTMPEFGERDLGPLVIVEREDGVGTPIPADLIALSEYLRGLQR